MAIMLLWPAVMLSGVGYSLMAVADFVDGAVAHAAPMAAAERRRSEFRVIQGGKLGGS
jgi:hypothetical protein